MVNALFPIRQRKVWARQSTPITKMEVSQRLLQEEKERSQGTNGHFHQEFINLFVNEGASRWGE